MGLKYFTRYRDFNGKIRQVRFSKEGFDGTPIEWKNDIGAVKYSWGSSDSFFPDQPIVAGQAHIALIFEEQYDLTDLVVNRKNYYVEVQEEDTGDFIWSGWLEPWDASHSYQKPPYQVNMTASCGLAHLSRKKYINPGTDFKKTGLQIIRDCLAAIGRDNLPIRVSAHMLENGFAGDEIHGLESFEENTFRYFDDNGEAMYCDVIVNNILNHFNAEIVQYRNVWVIRAIVDNATGADTRFFNIGDTTIIEEWPLDYVINSEQAKSLNGGNIRTLAPINKYRTEIDFGQQKPFFENGNMLIWTEDGLVGWDFSHMAKGNPGWERFEVGAEISRGVLKINGKSPQPYKKKKKKKFWQIAVPILTGMIGANLKNDYEYIEPAEYIESPGGSIGKSDKSVTISFDYETEAFSSDILISIRIPVTDSKGKVKNFWVDPSSQPALAGADKTKASASENFCLIRIPPVDLGSLTDKGTIDVSGNPPYPAANYSPGSKQINWTWTVTGVPSGEYRRIGGVNGVLVENGDLIIARVPNLGGSQEAVGGNWEVVNVRNNTKKGKFELGVSLNTTFITKAGEPFPADKVYVRFYKMADDKDLPGDWYKVYNLDGKLDGFVASDESGKYATTLERGDVTDEEASTIQLISGDYTPWYVGSWTRPGSNTLTSSWKRRPALSESMSIYRAMMKDRLCMTTKSLTVVEGNNSLLRNQPDIHYLHRLYFADQDKYFRQVRFSFTDATRQFEITAVEIRYEEIPNSELKQNSYIPGSRQLNTVPGEGDGIYPSKEDSTNGRLIAEDIPLTNEELEDRINAGSRTAPLFENFPPLVFIAGQLSSDSVDLAKYLSEAILYNNADQEEEDQFDFNDLHWEVVQKPTWVLSQTVVFMNVTATAKPTSPGKYSILFKLYDSNDLEEEEEIDEETGEPIPKTLFFVEVEIPIIVYPPTKAAYSLLETASGSPLTVGALPGGYMVPEKSDIRISISGSHDYYQFTLEGGGDTGKEFKKTVSSFVEFASSGIYRFFEESDGYELPKGVYRLFAYTAIEEKPVFIQDITFVLYDEEFLAKCKFFFAAGGTDIGEIELAGTSIFRDPGSWDPKAAIDDVEHDKAIVRLMLPDGTLVKDRTIVHEDPVMDGTYPVYGADTAHPIGRYTVGISLYLDGEEVLMRTADFATSKAVPQPVGGQLQLLAKSASSASFAVVGNLPQTGGSFDLPATGWNIGSDAVTEEFDWEGDELYEFKGGGLIKVEMPTYVGRPSFIAYNFPITFSEYRAFDNLTSIHIAKIHGSPKTFRYLRIRKLGGQSGDIVAILSADFSFGPAVEIGDEVDIEEPGSGYVDFRARDGMAEEVIDAIKYFDVRVDNETIEIITPDDPALNWLGIKDKGVTYAKIQDMPANTLLGNMTDEEGTPGAVLVKKLLDDIVPGDLVIIDVLEEYVQQVIDNSFSGTAGFLPKFGADGKSIVDSIIRESAGKIGIGVAPTEVLQVTGNIKLNGQVISTLATGTAPMIIASSTKVENLNVDKLDDQHGEYYLDWDNFTNYKQIIAGSGLVDGGLLDEDRTISLGLPSTITNATTNSLSADSHTHEIHTSDLLPGSNVTFSASGSGVILGPNDITINAVSMPWTGVTGKPITLDGFGIVDAPTFDYLDLQLLGKENTFSKGDIIQGAGLSITGATLINKLVGSDDVTFALAASGVAAGTYRSVEVDTYGRVTDGSNPTTLAGYGLDSTVYTKSQVDALIAGIGGLSGSGLFRRVAIWSGTTSLEESSILQDSGTQLSVNGHIVATGGGIAVQAVGTLPTIGPLDGMIYYSGGSYYHWNTTLNDWLRFQTI